MSSAYSSERAIEYRKVVSELNGSGKVYEALVSLNKSLCCAEPGTEEISRVFEARAEIFFEVRQFEKCLRNISAARKHESSVDRSLLDELEENCKKNNEVIEDDLTNFIKLSHPENKKIPFLIENLQLCESEEFGRFIISDRDLRAGDVIAFEETEFVIFSPKSIYTRCFNCLRSNMLDLTPSSASVMFCSSKCDDETNKKFNGKDELIRDSLCGNDIRQKMLRIMSDSLNAAGSFDKLQQLVKSLTGKTVFDFDFSDEKELKKKSFTSISSLLPKDDCGLKNYLKGLLSLPDGERKDFFANFVSRIILIYMRNAVKLPGKDTNSPDGGLFLPFVALFNHSCDPNIYASFVDNKCLITAIKPIRADEQLFINYRKTFMEQPKKTRQMELKESYQFTCECVACANNFSLPNKLRRIDKSFKLPRFGRFGSNNSLKIELRKCFDFMNENSSCHPSFETCAILMRTRELIRTICERISFPFEGNVDEQDKS